MGGHGNILVRVYIQNIRPYLQRLARHPSYMQRRRATMACKVLQMSIPTLSKKNADDQPNFPESVPSINATVVFPVVEDHNSFV